ncbi:MAG: CehA/McbA family metallohydrolase [Acidobacteriota bacterium]|nr:CehA/McbA family metallohydrolase [Acidobacteriota bacterium]
MHRTFGFVLLAASLALSAAFTVLTPHALAQEKRWYKGNTHAHTINSDGDSTPIEVVTWYRENGYNFLVLSDHNILNDVSGLNSVFAVKNKFLLIPGEEVTDGFQGKAVHINGLSVREVVKPQGGDSVVSTLQNNVTAIRKADGIPHVNHPNYLWSFGAKELKSIKDLRLFEVFNSNPQNNNHGGGGFASMDQMWDDILSAGLLMYGIAVDDAHHFKNPWDKTKALPGGGYVMVRAANLTPGEILRSLEGGDFYATTGVHLKGYTVTDNSISVEIDEDTRMRSKYRVQFIGQWGKVLQEVITNPAVYTFKGDETYVRAKIFESNGKYAWTQPAFLKKR